MKATNPPNQTKTFPLRLGKLILILCGVCLALCAAGIAVTVVRIVENEGIHNLEDVLKFPLLIAVCLLCALLVVSLLIRSRYLIDDKFLTVQFGLIKTKYSLADLTALVVNQQNNKITFYQGEAFFVLSVQSAWSHEFVHAILEKKENLDVSYTLTDNKPPKEDKKDK